jgi:hypothetical protein
VDRRLYFIVRRRQAAVAPWQFPRAAPEAGETVRAAAERALADVVGDSIGRWFVGNAPIGHCNTEDSTQFFMKAQILDGDVAVGNQ